jgi:hypothetical protein
MRIARVESAGDPPASLVKHGILTPDRPLAVEGPLAEEQVLGELVSTTFIEHGAFP